MTIGAWIAIASTAAVAAVLLARRRAWARLAALVIFPLWFLTLAFGDVIPRTPATRLAVTAVTVTAALGIILWLLWRLPRDSKVRPAALAAPLLVLIGVLPAALDEFLPSVAKALDWPAALVAAIGLTVVWDARRRWDDPGANKPWLVAIATGGGAALLFGALLVRPGAAASWVLIPIGLAAAAAIGLMVRAYWLE